MDNHPADIVKIARFYRAMNISALIYLIGFSLSTTDPQTAPAYLVLKLILLVIAIPSLVYSVSRLSFALGGHYRFLVIIFQLLLISFFAGEDAFPMGLLGLFIVFCVLTFVAGKRMKAHGLKMGFLGPKIRKPPLPIK